MESSNPRPKNDPNSAIHTMNYKSLCLVNITMVWCQLSIFNAPLATGVNALKYVGIIKRVMISGTRIQVLKMENVSLKLKPAF